MVERSTRTATARSTLMMSARLLPDARPRAWLTPRLLLRHATPPAREMPH